MELGHTHINTTMANVSDPAISEAYQKIRSDSSGINWVVLGYANPTTIKVDATGSGGVSEAVSHLSDSEVQYAMFKLTFTAADDTKRTKFVFVAWGGERASPLKKGKMSVHKASVKSIFKDFALELATGDRNELDENSLLERVKAVNY